MAKGFISHITEDKEVAARLRNALTRDFLGLLEIFLSSDTESISAGEAWLESVEEALRESALMMVLCGPESVGRPWINFEAGAAWMRRIPLIPVCHAGLEVRNLPMPLCLRHGLAIGDASGLRSLYARVAAVLGCQLPALNFGDLSRELSGLPSGDEAPSPIRDLDADILRRLEQALNHPRFKWRSVETLATEAAVPEDTVCRILRSDARVRLSIGQTGNRIAGLISRVGSHR